MPSNLASCNQPSPAGTALAGMGLQGWMKRWVAKDYATPTGHHGRRPPTRPDRPAQIRLAPRKAGASDQEAHEAAVAAMQSVLALSWKEASVAGNGRPLRPPASLLDRVLSLLMIGQDCDGRVLYNGAKRRVRSAQPTQPSPDCQPA